LPTRRFEAGDKHFGVKAMFDFGRGSAFEKEIDSFFEVGCGPFDYFSLTGYVKFWTENNIAVMVNTPEFFRHSLTVTVTILCTVIRE